MNYISNDVLVERLEDEIISHYHGVKPTQQDFALKCGVSVGYVNDLLNVTNDIREKKGIREIIAVANELNVSVDYLLGLSDVKGSSQEAKNKDFISKHTGLTLQNLEYLNDVARGKYNNFFGPYIHQDSINEFINFFVELSESLLASVSEYFEHSAIISTASKHTSNMNNDDWIYLFLTCDDIENKYLFDLVNLTNVEERERALNMMMYKISYQFTNKINKFFDFDNIVEKCEQLKQSYKKAQFYTQNHYRLICDKESQEAWINNYHKRYNTAEYQAKEWMKNYFEENSIDE